MTISRRGFLVGLGAISAGALVSGTVAWEPQARAAAPVNPEGRHPRWGMVIDLPACIGCQACTVSCQIENGVPPDQFRTLVALYEVQTGDTTAMAMLPRLCNHCDKPPCVPVCPVKATYQRDDGIVVVDANLCVGCGYCVQACPYGARFINSETHTADKCNFCVHRLEAGLLPACVETCVGGARVIGDLSDANSRVSRMLAEATDIRVLKPEAGTEPQVFYLGLDEVLQSNIEGEPTLWEPSQRAANVRVVR